MSRYGMKYLALVLLAACAAAPKQCNTVKPADLAAETVGLIAQDEDGDYVPYCTGVWVSPTEILTAGHCAAAIANGGDPRGLLIAYINEAQVTGQFTEPRTTFGAVVVKYAEGIDLALLHAVSQPSHGVARLGVTPAPGDDLWMVGQNRGYYWTHMRGTFSRIWTQLASHPETSTGPWGQVTVPASPGMSGSGAFDSSGRLVGIMSLASQVPSTAFYVPVDTIREFLRESK